MAVDKHAVDVGEHGGECIAGGGSAVVWKWVGIGSDVG